MQLEIVYRTDYHYEPAVTGGVTLLRMRPRSRPGLVVHEAVTIADPGFITRSYIDAWGTFVEVAEFDRTHSDSMFEIRAKVETTPAESTADLSPAERYLYTHDSSRAPRAGIASLGWDLGGEGHSWISVESLLRWLPQRFVYQVGATDAKTTLDEFVTRGAGVCQDFAHAMIAMLRRWGWAARYVSGYFFSSGAGSTRIEAEAMHAWVEAFRPGFGWIALDATAGDYADDRYVPVGYGRDYADVAPVRGILNSRSLQVSNSRLEITRQ